MTRGDFRIAAVLFVVTLGSYAYTFGGGGWNENATFALTRSIVEYRTISIEHFAKTTGDVSFYGGRTYSNKAPGTAFLATIVYAPLFFAERAAGLDPDVFKVTTFNGYVCTVLVCGVLGAMIPAALFLYGRERSVRWAVVVALAIAFGTPLFGYATTLFIHVPSAALLFLAYISGKKPFASGLFAAAATATNYLCGPAMVLIALLFVRTPRRLAAFAAGAALPLLVLGIYQHAAFGSFFRTPIETQDPRFLSPHAVLGVFTLPSAGALWGITFSPYRGLFFASPFLLLGVVGMFRNGQRAETWIIAAIVAFFLVANASFNGWWGGNAISARYLLPIVPFFGVFLLHATREKVLVLVLAAISIALHTIIAAVDIHPPDDIRRPITESILPQFFTGDVPHHTTGYQVSASPRIGHVAVNPVSVTTCDCYSVWSSFNLGEKLLGQGTVLSLLPLLLWMTGGALVLDRMTRHRIAAP